MRKFMNQIVEMASEYGTALASAWRIQKVRPLFQLISYHPFKCCVYFLPQKILDISCKVPPNLIQ